MVTEYNRPDSHEPDELPGGKVTTKGSRSDSPRLEQQAANAALYTKAPPGTGPSSGDQFPLDDDQKLSAAGAATSLKYANPKDLPSYPIAGLTDNTSSAGAAASLANAHQKPFEHWKPDPSASASAAAVLAKDYKMAELWHPEHNPQTSKAATLAAKEGGHVSIWRPSSTEYGHSAAVQAARMGEGLSPKLDLGYTAEGRKRSLKASTLAMSGGRQRAGSTPVVTPAAYPDAANAGYNALAAASMAHGPRSKVPQLAPNLDKLPPSMSAARIQHLAPSIPRDMFGSHPPVMLEVEEKKKNDAMRSAAVSMAKQMYELQQKAIVNAAAVHGGRTSTSAAHRVHTRQGRQPQTTDPGPTMMPVTNLEEAARKLAAERLAKLHDEHAAYRDYYGTNPQRPRSTLRGRTRRRASSMSYSVDDDEDEARSRRIRAEMSIFHESVSEVDTKKQQQDRQALLAVAQRNVRASLHGIDERVFADTGKTPPSLLAEWETKARATAEAESRVRMANYGRVNIGGGKYLDQSEVDAVAARNVQPVLDEINDKAELYRAKQEELRLDRERAKRNISEQKARDKEVKTELKKVKAHDKEEEKARKRDEKVKKAEETLRSKQDKLKPKAVSAAMSTEANPAVVTEPVHERATSTSLSSVVSDVEGGPEVEPLEPSRPPADSTRDTGASMVIETTETVAVVTTSQMIKKKPKRIELITDDTTAPNTTVVAESGKRDTSTVEPHEGAKPSSSTSPTSPKAGPRVKSWFKEKFARRASKGQKDLEKGPEPIVGDSTAAASVIRATTVASTSLDPQVSPAEDVGITGEAGDVEVSPVNDIEVDEDFRQPRSRQRNPSTLSEDHDGNAGHGKKATVKSSVGDNDGDDADTTKLALPAIVAAKQHRTSDSPVRDSKFLENL